MVEKIKTTDEIFVRAVSRGDRSQIEAWDRAGLLEWQPGNFAGQQLSEQAQAQRKAEEEASKKQGSEEPKPEPSRLDQMGVGKDERLWSGHPLTQRAIRSGDAELLGEIYADPRYDRLRSSGATGGFTSSDIEAYMNRDAS